MAENPSPNVTVRRTQPRGIVPPELIEVLVPPLKFGVWSGVSGALLGAGGAVIADKSPLRSGGMTGFHWFTLGTTYWFSRTMICRGFGGAAQMSSSERVTASALAGVPTGIISGMANSKARAVPSQILFWTVICGGVQWGVNAFTKRSTDPTEIKNNWLRSAWSPLQRLTDEEYLLKMDDQMLGLDADIAIIDERIAALKEKEALEKSKP
ncbi:hypothetical protein N3K66_007511 [Trichothecium roseum]|uniref:Uncharacterized protein n=1 Tax=Trichothecium roseum TaxID=47278 RepID=A0ACC0UU80_9HYPO|nr:hypothetical protein N3K66_007511 [Trichothecium roseum]